MFSQVSSEFLVKPMVFSRFEQVDIEVAQQMNVSDADEYSLTFFRGDMHLNMSRKIANWPLAKVRR